MGSSLNAKNASGKPLSLLWLRRDLRLHDHAALAAALKGEGQVQPVFVFDTDVLARFSNPQDRRLSFIADTLCDIQAKLEERGGGLIVLHGRAETLIPKLAGALGASIVYAAADFEPATRRRDLAVADALKDEGIAFARMKDHLILAPHEILKADGTPYKVFTPYSNAWHEKAQGGESFEEQAVKDDKGRYADCNALAKRATKDGIKTLSPAEGAAALLRIIGYEWQKLELWPAAEGRKRLQHFIDKKIGRYAGQRNFMGEDGTSRLSPYLRHGIVSVRECARAAAHQAAGGNGGAATWLKELIWREFYAMILFHFPHTERLEFQEQTRGLTWKTDKQAFRRFCEGKTGFPVVDAAMRELLMTGYMHNRARMIAASFLTKDLQMDWRLGEEHFAQHLMDYELASNVGGWQWAASTGTDAQPYFRIFNPLLQSKKFDPDGTYIRRFVPELAHLENGDIHEPGLEAKAAGYPAPIVEHACVKEKVLAMFKKAS